MTRNFDSALQAAKDMLYSGGSSVLKVIEKVSEDYRLTRYEEEELSDELWILAMGEENEQMDM